MLHFRVDEDDANVITAYDGPEDRPSFEVRLCSFRRSSAQPDTIKATADIVACNSPYTAEYVEVELMRFMVELAKQPAG